MSVGPPPSIETVTKLLCSAVDDTFGDQLDMKLALKFTLQEFLSHRRLPVTSRVNLQPIDPKAMVQGLLKPPKALNKPTGWPSWDPVIDRLWNDLLDTMPERSDRPRSRWVKPSGSTSASLLVVWHVPTTDTTRYPEYGVCADGSNPSLRQGASKFHIAPKLASMTENQMNIEHIQIRYEHLPDRTIPYRDLSVPELDILMRFKAQFWHASCAPVALLLGRENYKWYRKNFPSSTRVKLSEQRVYGEELSFFLEWDQADGSLKRLVFISYHTEAFFHPHDQELAVKFDAIWNMAATIAGYPLVNYRLFSRVGRGHSNDYAGNCATLDALESNIDDLGFDIRPWELAAKIRHAELVHNTTVPVNDLPSVLKEWLNSNGGYDSTSSESPAHQCMALFARVSTSKRSKSGGVKKSRKGSGVVSVATRFEKHLLGQVAIQDRVKDRDALKTPEQLEYYKDIRIRSRDQRARKKAGTSRPVGQPPKFTNDEERKLSKKARQAKRMRDRRAHEKAGLVNVAPKGFPFRTADEPPSEAELKHHARKELEKQGKPEKKRYGMAFLDPSHITIAGQIRWNKVRRTSDSPQAGVLTSTEHQDEQSSGSGLGIMEKLPGTQRRHHSHKASGVASKPSEGDEDVLQSVSQEEDSELTDFEEIELVETVDND